MENSKPTLNNSNNNINCEEQQNNSNSNNTQTCPICLSQISSILDFSILPCDHMICSKCITEFIQNSNQCPICSKAFFSYTTKSDNVNHLLSQENLIEIDNKKKEYYSEENFSCITVDDIEKQLQFIKSHVDKMYNQLFGPRGEKGSEKENDVLTEIYFQIGDIKEMIKKGKNEGENFCEENVDLNLKKINEIIDKMIIEIKKVEKREYKDYIEMLPDNQENHFDIEYCTSKKNKKGKKRKKK